MRDEPSDRRATFEALFRADSDPWNFEDSDYERDKRAATVNALGARRFGSALEVGCASGVLTAELATRCERLTAIDVSQTALDLARSRISDLAHVRLLRGEVPGDWPTGRYDAIILSEILYFLTAPEIAAVSRLAHDGIASGGIVLLVNWTGDNECEVDGDEAVELFRSAADWRELLHRRATSYRMDCFEA